MTTRRTTPRLAVVGLPDFGMPETEPEIPVNEALGFALHPDVLPFSNLPGYLTPFLLRPDRAMTLAG